MTRYIVVETYYIGRTVGVNCEQMIEFASKIKKGKPCEMDLPFLETISHVFFSETIRVFYSRCIESWVTWSKIKSP